MNEPQEIWYRVVFTTKHEPGNEAHLRHIVDTHLTSKGVIVDNSTIII